MALKSPQISAVLVLAKWYLLPVVWSQFSQDQALEGPPHEAWTLEEWRIHRSMALKEEYPSAELTLGLVSDVEDAEQKRRGDPP